MPTEVRPNEFLRFNLSSDFFLFLPFFSSFSIQYCEFYPEYEKCKAWLEKNLPDEFEKAVQLGECDP